MLTLAKRLHTAANRYRESHRPRRIDGKLFQSPQAYYDYLLYGDEIEQSQIVEFIHDNDHNLYFVIGGSIESYGNYLCHWHSGMDAIYAAGSSIIVGSCDWWILKDAIRLLETIKVADSYDEAERKALCDIGHSVLLSWPSDSVQYANE